MIMKKEYMNPHSEVLTVVTKSGVCVPEQPQGGGLVGLSGPDSPSPTEAPRIKTKVI